MRRALGVAVAVLVGCVPATAHAGQPVKLVAHFEPDVLGASTTIKVGFRLPNVDGNPPLPLDHVRLLLPNGIGIAAMTLGLATCTETRLEDFGPEGCSPNSVMGRGVAGVEVPIGGKSLARRCSSPQ